MQVEQIKMDPAAAAAKLEAWRHRLKRNPDPERRREYEGALAGYKALARGTPVVALEASVIAAGVDANGLPVLAVVRADAKKVSLQMDTGGTARFIHPTWRGRHPSAGSVQREFAFRFPGVTRDRWSTNQAIVPMIPPDVGPKRIDLKRHVLLWEALWRPEPPVDPMLLRPLGGDLYAVIAAWDLTPIERAVIAGRLH